MSKIIKINPAKKEKPRYLTNPKITKLNEKFVRYDNAANLSNAIAKELIENPGERITVLVSGSFIFGDFIEAFILNNRIKVKKMTLCTLSYNENNIDSLKTLTEKKYVDELNIIVSDYFFGHERMKNGLIPYTYQKLDNGNFQLAVERTHCKVYLFETYTGRYFVVQGSVNLRSSGNTEQFTIQDNEKEYRFYDGFFSEILERSKTIDKSIKFKKSWHRDQAEKEAEEEDRVNPPQKKENKESKDGTREWTRHFEKFDF